MAKQPNSHVKLSTAGKIISTRGISGKQRHLEAKIKTQEMLGEQLNMMEGQVEKISFVR